jgi:hypothetical protein
MSYGRKHDLKHGKPFNVLDWNYEDTFAALDTNNGLFT